MTDSYLGNNSDEELDAEIKDSENLDRTLSEIIEGVKTPSCSSTSPSTSSGSDITPPGTSKGINSGLVCGSVRDCDSTDLSSLCGVPANVRKTLEPSLLSSLEGTEDRPPTTTPKVAATDDDSNVMSECDDSGFREDKGKTVSSTVVAGTGCGVGKSVGGGGLPSEDASPLHMRSLNLSEDLNPDIRSPGQRFPQDWELYDEVVLVDSKRKVEVLCRSSPDKNSAATRSRESLEKWSSSSGSAESLGRKFGLANITGAGGKTSLTKSADFLKTNKYPDFNTSRAIPDVEVIYEPSAKTSVKNKAALLKESTV